MAFEDEPEGIKEIIKDPLENAKQLLRDKQETIYTNPEHKYLDIEIPTKGKVGDKCVIKFSGNAPKVEVAVSEDIKWEKRDKYDKLSKPELITRAFILDEHLKHNKDKVEFIWQDVGIISGEPKNMLRAGEYMVEVRVWDNESWEETIARRLITITK